jgi:hypothetical protein
LRETFSEFWRRGRFAQDAIARRRFRCLHHRPGRLPESAEKGFIVDLTDKLDANDKSGFAGSALDTVSWNGKIYALPIIAHNCAPRFVVIFDLILR